jgi:predicted polyphosphate/ATP-dependent NAD kinase
MKRIGLIINPIAGMGGRVGLKGTDGLAAEARRRGAEPSAGQKAAEGLQQLQGLKNEVQLLVSAGDMGEAAATATGLGPRVVSVPQGYDTRAEDTRNAARVMMDEGAELILFAGGDGTARDIYRALGEAVPVIGIPAGVKIHSPVFAQTPARAGELAQLYLTGRLHQFDLAEVLDIDEEAYRGGQVKTRLYGYLNVPVERSRMQNRKCPTPLSESASQNAIAMDIIDNMEEGILYLIGPGSTTRRIMDNLGLDSTLLGVDMVIDKQLVEADVTEQKILSAIGKSPFKVVVTPIGGQGYIFGRGNHQLSHRVLDRATRAHVIVGATQEKLLALRGGPLLVDSGNAATDAMLCGYIRVTTGYRQQIIMRVR